MCSPLSRKKIFSFAIALTFGLSAANFFQSGIPAINVETVKIQNAEPVEQNNHNRKRSETDAALKIISKPKAYYTEAARRNNTQGTVVLRVTFLDTGEVGAITPVSILPDGLTEQAIAAARRISFEPAKINGNPQIVTKQVQYTFTIY